MSLVSLDISNFRCIEHAQLQFDPRCTVIVGENAAGKTSILEAVHVLSSGRSFRTHRTELLAKDGSESEFLVTGRIIRNGVQLNLGIKWGPEGKEAHLNGRRCKGFADLAAALPLQTIDPGSHRLMEDGPSERRRFLDWGVFHVKHAFIDVWRSYQLALRQRNAALKSQSSEKLVRVWDEQLSRSGEEIASFRDHYVLELAPIFREFAKKLLGSAADLSISRGWNASVPLREALATNWRRDLRYRGTTIGPHRADLAIHLDGTTTKDRISRGQQKLLACALILAQLQYRANSGADPACLLLDDPAAELDVHNLGKLLDLVSQVPAQLIATAVDLRTLDAFFPGKKFHVEQGRTTAML